MLRLFRTKKNPTRLQSRFPALNSVLDGIGESRSINHLAELVLNSPHIALLNENQRLSLAKPATKDILQEIIEMREACDDIYLDLLNAELKPEPPELMMNFHKARFLAAIAIYIEKPKDWIKETYYEFMFTVEDSESLEIHICNSLRA